VTVPEPTALSRETLMDRWESAIHEYYDDCYWPGPWTLDVRRAQQLVGREDDIRDLIYLIRDKRLTVLSGDSGVGKSSLLEAGLIPSLREDGYITLRCSEWRDDRTIEQREQKLEGLSSFLTRKFTDDLLKHGIEVEEPDQLVEQLDEKFGRQVVLVLDQFEEVIRQQPRLFADLTEWIEAVVKNSRLRVLVSLRSEYAHHLSDLEVGAFSREDQPIPAIRKSNRVREIINSGRAVARHGQPIDQKVIEPAATDALVDLWVEAGADDRKSRIRLLHLQAMLYSLWHRFHDTGAITLDNVTEFITVAKDSLRRRALAKSVKTLDLHDSAVAVFEWALAGVVGLHVELCSSQLRALRRDGFADVVLEEGVRHSLVRLAEYLSSGGYKVDQEEVHLAELVLSEELRTLGYFDDADIDEAPEDEARAIIRSFAGLTETDGLDWVALPTRDLEVALGLTRRRSKHKGVSAGALLGHRRERVLVEECRRFFLALKWLQVGNLVRTSPSDDGRNFLALSHDGFGRGLNEWADDNDARPQTALHALTATFGKAFEWPTARVRDPALNPLYNSADGNHRLYVNLRWRSCRVVGTPTNNVLLRNVVFMNCDLRGTSFERCSFQGVTFVNCLLDGVQFNDCKVIGRATPVDTELALGTDRPLPSFVRPDQSGIVATLAHYRGDVLDSAAWIYSGTSGVSVSAAEIVASDRIDTGAERFVRLTESMKPVAVTGVADDQSGGLTMFGGRLSSLAFYQCDFPQDAEVALRHVAGTSLDFFEHTGGRIGLFDVAIRGITVSPPITASLPGAEPVHVDFEASDSHLENIWFSGGLEGKAEIARSVVWQLFNGSQGADGPFRVLVDGDSPHLGVSNVPDVQVLGPAMHLVRGSDPESGYESIIRKFVARIDYRSPDEQRIYDEESGAAAEQPLEQSDPDK